MPASYPTSAKTFVSKANGGTIDAAHVNDVQLEVTAVEQDLLAGLPVARGGTGGTSLTANRVLLGNGTSAVAVAGAGTAGQVLTSNGASAPTFQDLASPRSIVCGRLSLTTGVAVTTADVTAAGTLYYALYQGNQIGLYTGSDWQVFTISELSIAVPAAANQVYDVFVNYNAGTPALALTAWTNDTTRATALTTQDGILVKTGSTGQRYVGTVRTVTASQLNDSAALRHVWNYYHRVTRLLLVNEATNSWTYSTATHRQSNNSAANQIDLVCGVAEESLQVNVIGYASNDAGGCIPVVSVGTDGIATTSGTRGMTGRSGATSHLAMAQAALNTTPAIGRHYYTALEYDATGAGTTTWYGDNGGTIVQSGIAGIWRG